MKVNNIHTINQGRITIYKFLYIQIQFQQMLELFQKLQVYYQMQTLLLFLNFFILFFIFD
jgi:hypothetical protein